jgi:hypothetical protein
MEQNHQWEWARAPRPDRVSLDIAAGAAIEEPNSLPVFDQAKLLIRNHPSRVARQ